LVHSPMVSYWRICIEIPSEVVCDGWCMNASWWCKDLLVWGQSLFLGLQIIFIS
jgi:hypothetical protein